MSDLYKILFVEDDSVDRMAIKREIQRQQLPYQYQIVASLSSAQEKLAATEFDVVICDYNLEDGTAPQLFESLSDTPVIVTTGAGDEHTAIAARKAGAYEYLIKDQHHNYLKVLPITVENTIQRNREKKQIRTLAKFSSENPNPVMRISSNGTLLYANEGSSGVMESWNAQVGAQLSSYILPLIQNALEHNEHQEIEIKAGGSIYSLIFVPIVAEGYVNVYGRDMTTQKQYEQQLLVEQHRLKALYDVTTSGNLSFDQEFTKLLEIGARFLNMDIGIISQIQQENYTVLYYFAPPDTLKKGQKFVLQKTYCDITFRGNEVVAIEHMRHSLYATHPCYQEFQLESYLGIPLVVEGKKFGTLAFCSTNYRVITFTEADKNFLRLMGKWVSVALERKFSRDRRKKLLEELKVAKSIAEDSAAAKQQFLANMSHEIRTPMNAILGMTYLLQQTKLNKQQQEYATCVHASAQHLLTLLNDILDLSKIEAGKMKFLQEPFAVLEIKKHLESTIHFSLGQKNISFAVNIAKDIPANICGDKVRLQQILLNLVSNAVKFTQQGSIVVDITLKKIEDTQLQLQFVVTDSGIGIAPEKLETIFESFTQAENDTDRTYGGTGLGLTITKKLIALQQGSITVKSTVGKGTVFTVILPFTVAKKTADACSIAPKNILPEQVGADFLGMQVLLVEDNTMNQQVAVGILHTWQVQTDIAENGNIALQKIEDRSYDLILMDIQMPELDGYETTKRIRAQYPKDQLPIIAMSAHALKAEQDKAFAAGMNEYIAKPFQPDELKSKLQKFYIAPQKTPSSPKSIIDWNCFRSYMGEREELVRNMQAVFAEQLPEEIACLQGHQKQKDTLQFLKTIHKIKPLLKMIGVQSALDLIHDLETSKKNPTEKQYSQLQKILAQVLRELQASNFQS